MTITVIALVAVVMGLSTIAPMMQYAYASHGQPLPANVCAALASIPAPAPGLAKFIAEHCDVCPPNCSPPLSVESKTF